MFKKLFENSILMCDVALWMWLHFSLFLSFSMQIEEESRPSENTENGISWEPLYTHRMILFQVITKVFINFQRYATICSRNRDNESFRLEILEHVQKTFRKLYFDVWCSTMDVIAFLAVSVIFNANWGGEQTEREHRERNFLRAFIHS